MPKEGKMKYYLSFFLIVMMSSSVFAQSVGKVIQISFASSVTDTVRPGSVQFTMVGGFSDSGCNATYAAIHPDDKALVSLLISAKMVNRDIVVSLNSNHKYFADRCYVKYLSMN